jgi:hypothetical protein
MIHISRQHMPPAAADALRTPRSSELYQFATHALDLKFQNRETHICWVWAYLLLYGETKNVHSMIIEGSVDFLPFSFYLFLS